MANNRQRPQFKHPIPGSKPAADSDEIKRIDPDVLVSHVRPQKEVLRVLWSSDITLIVRTMITVKETMKLVDMVMSMCSDDTGCYYEMADFAFRCAIITYYSNITLPDGLEQKYEIVYGTDLYNTILQYINKDQVSAISKAIDIYMKH